MKRFFTPVFASVLLLWSLPTVAQHSVSHPDSLLLSDVIEGNEKVRRYRVDTPMEADYALHYAISSAILNQQMGDNGEELAALAALMRHAVDTMQRVEQVQITGYASPDGPEALNSSLAKRRAQDVKSYADKQFHLSDRCSVTLDSGIAPWSAVREQLASSSVEGKGEALKVLDGDHTPAEKQAALRSLPAVWRFLAREVLPSLRRVVVEVHYQQGQLVETRTVVAPKPAPTPPPTPVATQPKPKTSDPCCEELLTRETVGIIVAMPDSEVDY